VIRALAPDDAVRRPDGIVLNVALPSGTNPAVVSALQRGMEEAVSVVLSDVTDDLLVRADLLAGLVTGLSAPDPSLIEERLQRQRTMQTILAADDWLTAEMINTLQSSPPPNKSHPASDWKRRGRIYSVSVTGKEYFAGYQFDAMGQPLPIIRDILGELGPVADSWKIAAWFHFPNGRIAEGVQGEEAPYPVAPKDALDRPADVLAAARKMRGSYVA
jgi:hypothetical protein